MIKGIHPKVFVFENVRAFMKSTCTDLSGKDMSIKESIFKNLSEDYNIYWKVINFKDYGVPSSRPRTIVIGTSKELKHITPLQLFPTRQNEILLRDSIGGFPRLAHDQEHAGSTPAPATISPVAFFCYNGLMIQWEFRESCELNAWLERTQVRFPQLRGFHVPNENPGRNKAERARLDFSGK